MDVSETAPRVWVLVGNRQGDNNQMLALAEALGLPYETKNVSYNPLRKLAFLRGERLFHVTRETRRSLAPPWPDLVVGLGYESMPISRYIRRRSGGRTRLVQFGNPRTRLDDIDLVIASPQYCVDPGPNVLLLPFPVGNPAQGATPALEEEQWLGRFPVPRRIVAVGGATRQWKLDVPALGRALDHLQRGRDRVGGSVIAAVSRRTPEAVTALLRARLSGDCEAVVDDFPRFAVLLAQGDEFHVTADSVSMLSEAILTGKPVGMIPIVRSTRGKADEWLRRLGLNLKSYADLTRFWGNLKADKLIGTVEHPLASTVPDTVATAVAAVRLLLDGALR